ncbi:MAG: ATP-binding cassette domain-containing protein [Oscillospiraceae bacterium]|nr:ATP-binding cassette domain-containing protein [Oscillospiraceae bacterium]
MNEIITMTNLSKTFRTLNRHEGLKGSIRDLFSRDYKYVKAVDSVSASIEKGSIVGYLGPNGAGKSTTIKMMTGILQPTSGEIIVNGLVPYRNRVENAANIGVVFGQRSQLWWSLPVIESFKVLKEIYKIDTEVYKSNLKLFNDIVDLEPLYMKPVRQMSLGQRTLCDIVAAFLHDPKIVFLDEPTIGLDVSMKSRIRDIIMHINKLKGTTIILTTHDIGDVEALCRQAVIIDKGKMVFNDNFENLKNRFGKYRTLRIARDPKTDAAMLDEINEICQNDPAVVLNTQDETKDEWFELLINEDKTPLARILSHLMNKYGVKDIKIDEIRTEDIIRKIYEG